MKKNIFAIAAVAVAILTISSCKKKDDTTASRHDMIVGTWKQTQEGSDDNSNGTWDASEHVDVAAADQLTAVFNSNGTGTFSQNYMGTPISGTTVWTLMNNDNDLRVIVTVPLLGVDTVSGSFSSFTGSQFDLKDASVTPADYMHFQKQ